MCPSPCAIPESSSEKFRRWPPNSQDAILAHSAAQKRSDTLIAPCQSGTARGRSSALSYAPRQNIDIITQALEGGTVYNMI